MVSPAPAVPQAVPPALPSPVDEEDLSQSLIHEYDTPKRKGKERESDEQYPDAGSNETLDTPDSGVYPPTNEDEAETRRVEENLRRWEVNERQRRKAARETASGSARPTSVISGVSKRASLLWSSKSAKQSRNRPYANHTALQSEESIDVPLSAITATSTPSPTRTTRQSESDDPFNPPESLSPFADQQATAVMHASPDLSTPAFEHPPTLSPDPSQERPTILAMSSFSKPPPPPQPLGLPPPRTPPPPIDVPPSPTQSPSTTIKQQTDEEIQDVLWWHDWLCGCSEGKDRGGHNQAGQTNPFE